MVTATIEEQLSALEAEIARLRAAKNSRAGAGGGSLAERTSPDFLRTTVGIHANSPAFEEVTHVVEAEREREREETRREGDATE